MMTIFRLSFIGALNSLLISLAFFSLLNAQENSSFVVHIPKLSGTINIDGSLSDGAWKEAAIIDDFYTYRPVDGQPASEKTAVLLGYDASSLYVAFICYDPAPEQIRSSICNRDDIENDDTVVLYLDTFNSGKETYHFSFNPYGIQADGIYIDMVDLDFKPDFILYSKGKKFAKGYIVEAEIPFKSLRFPDTNEMVWGIAAGRTIKHLDKDIIWPAISRNATAFVPQFGKLYGLENIQVGNNVEFLPEATAIRQENINTENDELTEKSNDYNLGLNLKVGFLSNLILDMAYNPDFSQVEADADKIDVNRRFPLFYPEKRPFFLEGTNIFQTPINAVYTRRIVDPLLGVKLTGNVNGYEIGILGGIDEYYGSDEYLSEVAFYRSLEDNSFNEAEFYKEYKYRNSYHTVFRLRKEVWDYSNIGLLVTGKNQSDAFNRTYGIDGNLLIADEYSVTFQALNSETRNHFGDYRNDPAFYFNLFRGSRTFNFQLFYNDVFPDFEVANGFIQRVDFREGGIHVWYDFRFTDSFFTLVRPAVYLNQMYDHPTDTTSSKKIENYIAPLLTIEAIGQNTFSFGYYRQFEEYFGFEFNKTQYLLTLNNKTLPWLFADISLFWGDGIYYDAVYTGENPFLGSSWTFSWELELKPVNNWALNISGSNYIFDGKNEGVQTRIVQDIYRVRSVYQFTRDISLRVILQPGYYENNLDLRDLDLNILAAWQPSPGTVIFLGYNDYFVKGDLNQIGNDGYFYVKGKKYNRNANGLFLKFSYLIRL